MPLQIILDQMVDFAVDFHAAYLLMALPGVNRPAAFLLWFMWDFWVAWYCSLLFKCFWRKQRA